MIRKIGHGPALSVYQYAKTKAQYKNRVPDFTSKEISEALGIRYRTALRAVKKLIDENIIAKVGTGRDTAFYINPAYFQKGRIETMQETCRLFLQKVKPNAETTRDNP